MTDAFAALVGPIVQHLIEFQGRLARGEHPPLGPEHDKLLTMLGEAEQRASTSTQSAHDFELARHALVYWIDEILINSSWEYSLEWKNHILEWDIYRERLRADRFFEKAREAEALAGTDPLETFYLCVALGFRGRFAVEEPRELLKWGERAYARVLAGSRQPDRFLPDEAADLKLEALRPLPGKSVLLAVSILVSASVLTTLACFILAVHLATT